MRKNYKRNTIPRNHSSYHNNYPTVEYSSLTVNQRDFLLMLKPLMKSTVQNHSYGDTTIKVIGKILRNDNYKEADKEFLNFGRRWYKNYLVLEQNKKILSGFTK